jgi:hypothetical protein
VKESKRNDCLTKNACSDSLEAINREKTLINDLRKEREKVEALEREIIELNKQVDILKNRQLDFSETHNILSICSFCKKIKSDEGHWLEVERFFSEYDEYQFSHGICHTCFDDHYKGYDISDSVMAVYHVSPNRRVSARIDNEHNLTLIQIDENAGFSDLVLLLDVVFSGSANITPTMLLVYERTQKFEREKASRDVAYIFDRLAVNHGEQVSRIKKMGFVYNEGVPQLDVTFREILTVGTAFNPQIEFKLFSNIEEALSWAE